MSFLRQILLSLTVSCLVFETLAIPPIASVCTVQWVPSTNYDIFTELIHGSAYNKDVRPTNLSDTTSTATNIKINYYVIHIESIDEVNGQFKAVFFFRQKWLDPRLAFENSPQYLNQCNGNRPTKLSLPDSMISDIWTPDLFIVQELKTETHSLYRTNRFVKVSPNGEVMISQKLTMNFACPKLAFNRSKVMECEIDIESYGHNQEEMTMDWMEEHPVHYVKESLFVPKGFKLDKIEPLRCDTIIPSGKYSCIKGKFFFSKQNL